MQVKNGAGSGRNAKRGDRLGLLIVTCAGDKKETVVAIEDKLYEKKKKT